ncbi:hypothetical protein Pcinc_041440 [Petrolisthes cinctipes]|uniref:Uncharacterized protein n=1 Tax=Petrolisthes cinctipes TaxID=88211 RepID=A0AAE1BJK2_PETCI|nr:hypothetical protein Pcinc_041440 [Petrolisthes cinctipes]
MCGGGGREEKEGGGCGLWERLVVVGVVGGLERVVIGGCERVMEVTGRAAASSLPSLYLPSSPTSSRRLFPPPSFVSHIKPPPLPSRPSTLLHPPHQATSSLFIFHHPHQTNRWNKSLKTNELGEVHCKDQSFYEANRSTRLVSCCPSLLHYNTTAAELRNFIQLKGLLVLFKRKWTQCHSRGRTRSLEARNTSHLTTNRAMQDLRWTTRGVSKHRANAKEGILKMHRITLQRSTACRDTGGKEERSKDPLDESMDPLKDYQS